MHLSSQLVRERRGERSWAYQLHSSSFRTWWCLWKGIHWVSTKGAALSGLTGSRLSWTKLWGLIYVAAPSCWGWASCSLGVSKPSAGHSQATGLCSSAARDPRMELRMHAQNALHRSGCLPASGPISIPFSEDFPSRKNSPFSVYIVLPQSVYPSTWPADICSLPSPTPPPPGLPGILGNWHPFESHHRATGLSQEDRRSCGGDLLFSKAHSKWSMHMGYQDIWGHQDICGHITLQQSFLFH